MTNAEPEVSHDEDTFVVPAVWGRTIHPRRGGVPGPALTTRRDAAEEVRDLVKRLRPRANLILNDAKSDAHLAELGRGYLAGEDGTPEAAAAGAAVLTASMTWRTEDAAVVLVDAWVRDHGVVQAARAVAELAGIFVGADYASVDKATHIRRIVSDEDHALSDCRWLPLAYRMRAYLAAATDDEYQRARDAVAEYRPHTARQRAVAAYLFPDQTVWVDEVCERVASTSWFKPSRLLLGSVRTFGQLELVLDRMDQWYSSNMPGMWTTVAEGVGPAAAPVLARWLDDAYDADTKKRLLNVLAHLPSDEAFRLLADRLSQKYVQPAVLEAATRFPVRAMRLLGEAAAGKSAVARIAADLLQAHVRAHPDLVTAAPPSLRDRVEAMAGSATAVPDAAPDDLPKALVNPPWKLKRVAAKPVVVGGLVPTVEARIAWADGEREAWAAKEATDEDEDDWEAWAKTFAQGGGEWHAWQALVHAPETLVRPLLATWQPKYTFEIDESLRAIVARFGLDAVPVALHAARNNPACGAALLPFAHGEVATLMADWLARPKSGRATALAWLRRNPACAAAALIPAALAEPGTDRTAAEAALRAVAAGGHADTIRAAADTYGPETRAGIEYLLAIDPLDLVPSRIPTAPDWASPALHPQVLLRDRKRALPHDSVGHLVTMLAFSKPDGVYAGVALVKRLCDPGSLAEFAWSLFLRWQAAGLPSKDGWVLDALGLIGNDETVRRLTPIIRAWPGEGGHARAVNALNVLATIGTDVALMHLHGIAQKVKFKGLKERAGEKIAEVAHGLGLSAEQLADRLVPDLGLDADGSTTLDYGPRQFIVGFDEQLKPYVADPDGKRRKDLPKPGVKDDSVKAEDAYKRFAALKKDVRTIAADQIRRLENAMVWQRRWTGTEFHELFVAHPVLWHVVRRLVWGTYCDGGLVSSIRVAEDRSFADVNDDAVELDPAATVGIAHPLDLGETVGAWSGVFADYEILQPFPQLGRDTHRLSDEEREATRLTQFEGLTVPIGRVLGLERRGWVRGEPQDAGTQGWIFRVLPGGRAVVIELDPGIAIGDPAEFEQQHLEAVWLNHRPEGDGRPSDRVRLGDLDPVSVSEILRDLTELKG